MSAQKVLTAEELAAAVAASREGRATLPTLQQRLCVCESVIVRRGREAVDAGLLTMRKGRPGPGSRPRVYITADAGSDVEGEARPAASRRRDPSRGATARSEPTAAPA